MTSYSNLIETIRLSRTVFQIISLILEKLKSSRDSDHAPFGYNLSSVGWDLLCSIRVLNLKCLRLPATKKWKATPIVKILVLSHPLGDLGVTHMVHPWLDGKRVVDFLSAIIAILASFHGCGTIKRNLSKSGFSDGGGSLWAQNLGI